MRPAQNKLPRGDRRGISTIGYTLLIVFASIGLGVGLVVLGGNSEVETAIVAFLIIAALIGISLIAVDFPVIDLVRFAFIASFFFKSDFNLIRLDELEDPSGLNISLTLITGLVLLGYDLAYDRNDRTVFPAVFSFALAALMAASIASFLLTGMTPLAGVSVLSLCTSILIAYVVASHFGRPDRMKILIGGLALGVLVTGITALSQYLLDWPNNLAFLGTGTEEEKLGTQSIIYSRVPGFLRTPTGMAWVISTLLPLLAALVICRVKEFSARMRTLVAVSIAFGIIGLTLSLARGSWIAFIVAAALVLVIGFTRLSPPERLKYGTKAFAAVLIFAAVLLPFSDRIYERLTADDEGSAAIRVPMMENAWLMIKDNPIVGVGMNGYRSNMVVYDETGIFVSQVFPRPVHNVFAHVTAEVGVPGGILFCFLILFAMFECVRAMLYGDRFAYALGIGALAAFVAFVISGMKEPAALGSTRPPMRTLFLLLGIAMAIRHLWVHAPFQREHRALSPNEEMTPRGRQILQTG